MSTRDQGALDAPIAMRPDRRGLARGRDLLSAFLRGYLTRPRDYIVPQQINARVAIPYRAGRAIGKIWNGKAKPRTQCRAFSAAENARQKKEPRG
jgi:hypothetical protein